RVAAVLVALTVVAMVVTVLWLTTRHASSGVPRALAQRQLTANSSQRPVTSGAISPDGKYVAYVDSAGIHVQLLDTHETRTIPVSELPSGYVGWEIPAWFPDSTHFLVNRSSTTSGAHTGSVWVMSLLGDAPRKLRDDATAWCTSPNGQQIAFTTTPGPLRDAEVWV